MISTAELAKKEFEGLALPEPYGDFLGEIPTDASMAIWGPPGSGKSTFAIALAILFADHIGKGIYCSTEEGPGPSLQNKIKRLKAEHENILVSDFDDLNSLKVAIDVVDAHWVVIDSISKSNIKKADFQKFHGWCKENDVIAIFILHSTKDGKYKGPTEYIHDPDIEIRVEDGIASTDTKNRFQETPREMEVVFEREREEVKSETVKSGKRNNPKKEFRLNGSDLAGLECFEDDEFIRQNKSVTPDEIYQMITDRMISTIKKVGHLPWQQEWKESGLYEGRVATNFVSKKPYRGINYFMLNFETQFDEDGEPFLAPRDLTNPYFLTFNQVEKLNGKVEKGSRGNEVVYFVQLYSYEQQDPKLDFGTYSLDKFKAFLTENADKILGNSRTFYDREGVPRARKNPTTLEELLEQSENWYIPLLKYYNVFHAEDITGIDWGVLPENKNADLPEDEKIEVAELIYKHYPTAPKIKHDTPEAFYTPSGDFINMPNKADFSEIQHYYTTLFHEAVHSTGHKSRLDRELTGRKGSQSYAFEELIAEMGAVFLCAESGILFKTIDNSAKYLQGWNSRLVKHMEDDNKFFFRAASRSQAAADYILDRNDEGIPAYRKNLALIRENPETNPKCVVNVQAKTNSGKDGIEIRFSAAPPKAITEKLKDAGFFFYTPKGKPPFWAAKKTKKRVELAESIAGEFYEKVDVLGSEKPEVKSETAETGYYLIDSNNNILLSEKTLNKLQKEYEKKAIKGENLTVYSAVSGNSAISNISQVGNKVDVTWLNKEESAKSDKSKESAITIDFKADGSIQERGHYALVEVKDLIPSHNKDCSVNSKHKISKGQPRDRSLDALCSQPKFIAQNLNPSSITQGTLAFNGAPVVLPDWQVIQGNGRSIALKIAYDEHPKQAKKYKAYLKSHAKDFGLTKKEVDSYKQPVLVRVVDVSEKRAIELGNVVDTSQAKMSKVDQAKAYIRNLSKAKKQAIGNLINDSRGETLGEVLDDVGLRIMDQFKKLDRAELVEKNGLTSEGKDFLRSVFAGLVFDSDENKNALRYFLDLKHTQKAGLERSYGNIIPFIDTKADITPAIQKAIEIVAKVQKNDSLNTIADFMNQADAFEGPNDLRFSKKHAELAEFLLNASTQKEIRNGFRMYQWKITGKEDFFNPIEKVSPAKAFKAAFVKQERINPSDALIYIGTTEKVTIDNGNDELELEGDFPTFLSENKIYIVPEYRVERAKNLVPAGVADDEFEEWHNYEADDTDFAIDWPEDAKAKPVGTAVKIWYASDKVIQPGDAKGEINYYVHDFDKGKRPAVVKGDILIIGNIDWNERGILN